MVEENTTNKVILGKKQKKQLNLTKQHKICTKYADHLGLSTSLMTQTD